MDPLTFVLCVLMHVETLTQPWGPKTNSQDYTVLVSSHTYIQSTIYSANPEANASRLENSKFSVCMDFSQPFKV